MTPRTGGEVLGHVDWIDVKNGRGDKIRTCDPLYPKQVRYQAAPLPDRSIAMMPSLAFIRQF